METKKLLKQYLFLFGTSVVLLLATLAVFISLQNEKVFQSTLNHVTYVYHRDSTNTIVRDQTPYSKITETGLKSWDAGIYATIATDGYGESAPEDNYLFAFFPLFPYLWHYTALSASDICIINYLLFIFALLLFIDIFFRTKPFMEKLLIFTVCTVMPHTVNFNIPYTESLFVFLFALSFWGLLNNKYWLYFIAMIFFGMTRPAINVLLTAFICVELFYFIFHRNFLITGKVLLKLLVPLFIGTFCAMLIQYQHSHNMFSFVLAQKHWHKGFFMPETITDWSEYGYSISIFCEAFVILFSFGYLLYRIIYDLKNYKTGRNNELNDFSFDKQFLLKRFFFYSIVYFIGVFLLNTFTQKGSLNGIQRYIAATPFFYIFFFSMYNNITSKKKSLRSIAMIVFMSILGYVGLMLWCHRITFDDMGYFFFLGCFLYFYVINNLPKVVNYIVLALLIFLCIIWKTYMFQSFISNAWIFT